MCKFHIYSLVIIHNHSQSPFNNPTGLAKIVTINGIITIKTIYDMAFIIYQQTVDMVAIEKFADEGGDQILNDISSTVNHLTTRAMAMQLQSIGLIRENGWEMDEKKENSICSSTYGMMLVVKLINVIILATEENTTVVTARHAENLLVSGGLLDRIAANFRLGMKASEWIHTPLLFE